MKSIYVLAAAVVTSTASPAMAATVFALDATNSYVNVVSNDTMCILGSCSLRAELATPFQDFSLNVGESRTFDFADISVSSGFGAGSATLDAQLAFLLPSPSAAGTGGTASYLRLGGIFTPGALAGSLIWNSPSQQITAADGSQFTVSFGNLVGAQFGSRATAPVTITLNSASAVPEPTTWAMMLAGFGAVGFSLRSRTRKRMALAAA
jgi:hypothetical protein